LALCTVYLVIVARGVRTALAAEDEYGSYIAFGISVLFGVQALINLAVAMSMLPTKGLTLPFVSFGGSSLLVCAAAMGILLSISRKSGSGNARVPFGTPSGPEPEASAMLVTEASFAPATSGAPAGPKNPSAKKPARRPRMTTMPKEAL
jgi:cell division protein FtsW